LPLLYVCISIVLISTLLGKIEPWNKPRLICDPGLGFFGVLSLRLRMFLSSVYQKTLQWPNCFRFFSKHLIMFSNKWSNTLHEGKSTGLCEHSCKLDDRVWVCQGFTPWIPPWTSFLGHYWVDHILFVCVFIGIFWSSDQIIFWLECLAIGFEMDSF